MLKHFIISFATLVFAVFISVAQFPKDLKYGLDGEFKILQVSNCASNDGIDTTAAEQVERLIRVENPQLVIFSLGSPDGVEVETLKSSLKSICKDVPFAIVSHDSKSMVLPVNHSSNSSPAEILYLISGDISFNTVVNHRQKCKEKAQANSGAPVPSVAFMLRPLPEFRDGYAEFGSKKENGKLIAHTGNRLGEISAPENNYGLFTSFLEGGDVKAVFCGYDDDNDFALVWKNILLAYARNSHNGGKNEFGIRVIILKENSDELLTYIRTANNEVVDKCTYPTDFQILK